MDKIPQVTEVRYLELKNYFNLVESFLKEGKEVRITPKGDSMRPFIIGGRDSVVLTSLSRSPEVGDIVLAMVKGRYIMHRVIMVEGSRLTLMGDGNVKGTECCVVDDVKGIVSEIHKESGRRVKPGKGRIWRLLLPIRKVLLVIHKRIWK